MKKKLLVTIVAVLLVALTALTLAGCTISGVYEGATGKLEFSGKSFTFTNKLGDITEGVFVEEALELTDEDKEALKKYGIKEDGIGGSIVLKNDKDTSLSTGFYGVGEDGKEYIVLVPTSLNLALIGLFVKG